MEENEPSHKTIVVSKVLYSANPYSNPITGNFNFTIIGQVFVLSEPPLVLLMGSYIIGVIL